MPEYTLQHVYQTGDFQTSGSLIAPPLGDHGTAAGPAPYSVALKHDASPIRMIMADDESGFAEIGEAPQVLTAPLMLDGVAYDTGTPVHVTYRIADPTGFEAYAISLGQGKTGATTTNALLTNKPMMAGQTYHFASEVDHDATPHVYNDFACFTAGTLIKTSLGERPIENIAVGDRVMTRDHGLQTVRWAGARTMPAIGDMAPIAFDAGTLGCSRRLMVSPNHRMLISGAMAELVCGDDELLISAKLLVNGRNVRRMEGGIVTYIHIMFDYHEVIWANDCPSESFYAGDDAMDALNEEQAHEILTIFPDLRSGTKQFGLARAEAHGYEGVVIGATL